MPLSQSARQYLDSLPENIYGHRKKVSFVATRVAQWEDLNRRTPYILDVGCGTGSVITIHLARLGYHILGIDTDGPSITLAQSENQAANLQFKNVPIQDVDGRFDVIIFTEVLEHLSNPEELLAQARKKLTPDGVLIVTVPNGFGPFELEKALWKAMRMDDVWTKGILPFLKRVKRLFGGTVHLTDSIPENSLDESPHLQFFTIRRMSKLLSSSGFRVTASGKSSFIAGPFSATFLPRSQAFFRLNSATGTVLPAFLVNGLYFEAKLLSPEEHDL